MKRYLIGLVLTGLTTRLARRARGVVPYRQQSSIPMQVAGVLIGAGIAAGLTRLLSKKSWRGGRLSHPDAGGAPPV